MRHAWKPLFGSGLLLLLCASVSAQNPDYTLAASDTTGSPGGEAEVDITLDNSADPVDGWSFGLCHDPAQATPLETVQGVDSLALNNGAGADYFLQEILPDGVRNIAIVNFFGQEALQPGLAELLRITYLIEAPVGTLVALDFCGTLGDPPTDVIISANIEPVIPVQTSGSIEVAGTPVPMEFLYRLPQLSAQYDPATGMGSFSLDPTIAQTNGLDGETSAFSMAYTHDPLRIIPSAAAAAGPLLALNGGAGPDLFLVDLLGNGITIDVDYGVETIIYSAETAVVSVQYDTNAPNLVGTGIVVTDVAWDDTLGLANQLLVGSPPLPIAPALQGGMVTLIPLTNPAPDTFAITSASGLPGDTVVAGVFFSGTFNVLGWSYGVCHDGAVAEVVDVAMGATTLTINNGGPVEYFVAELFPVEGWVNGVVVNFTGLALLPPGNGYEIALADYSLTGSSGDVTGLDFCETLGSPPVDVAVLDENGQTLIPGTESGELVIEGAPPPVTFIRGDGNGDGSFAGLTDGIFILNFAFLGGPPPPCDDAADVDDDGFVNGIIDGIFALNYQFVPGSPPPPPPGVIDCGVDPTADPLDCESSPCP